MAPNSRSQRVDGSTGLLVELVATGVVVLGPDGSARYANPAWTSLTGQRAPTWSGPGWLDVLAAPERADRRGELLAATHRGDTWSDEWIAPDTPAGVRRLGVVAVPDHVGPVLETIVVTATDATVGPVRLDGLDERAHHPSHPSIDGLDVDHQLDLLAVATHELRSPLAALLGAAQLLDDWRNQLMTDVDTAIGIVGRQSARLARIIDDVLELDRSRQATDPPIAVALGSVIDQALVDAPPPAHAEVFVRVLDGADGRLEALTDRLRLTRVLVNLLTNAYRYGGSSIVVTARPHEATVLVEVEDDGDGVPAHVVPNLFAPFSRGANHIDGRADAAGNGLGLAIAREALGSIGGELRYSGVEPHGARFTITLPAVTGAAS